jgi:asparagine synthase (glutamine-hydrolysing)
MSGIAGIFYLDGRPAEQETIDQMVGAMEHRGPDGIYAWREGSVALGHCMLHTTPESLHENLPMTSRDGHLVLTADARIDNRDELMRILDVRPMNERPVTDSDLIMAAYQHWGKECPKHLLGAFAFALWDKRAHELFMARDHFGVRPLFYALDEDRRLVFASEIRALISHNLVDRRVNQQRVADYLLFLLDNKEYTFFENISRLNPGGWMLVGDQARKEVYYDLKLKEGRDYEPPSNFGKVFNIATKRRIRQKESVGCYLSGGVDSSSVLAQAIDLSRNERGGLSLYALSAVFDKDECDESYYINEVVRYLDCKLRSKNIRHIDILGGAQQCIESLSQPVEAHPLLLTDRLHDIIKTLGLRVVLDGHGGDEVAFKSSIYLSEVARNREILRTYRLIKHYPARERLAILLSYAGSYWIENRLLSRIFNKASRLISDRKEDLSRYKVVAQVINDDMLASYGFRERAQLKIRERHGARSNANDFQRWSLDIPLQVHALEELNGRALWQGHEPAFPFWDRELIECSLAIPAKHKLGDGLGRQPLRDAMKGKLPQEVLDRSDKTNFHKIISDSILRDKGLIVERWETVKSEVEDWLSPEGRRFVINTINSDRLISSAHIQIFWRLLLLGEWNSSVTNP